VQAAAAEATGQIDPEIVVLLGRVAERACGMRQSSREARAGHRLLEPPVAALAAERATSLELAELERSVDRARVAASRGEPMGTAVDLHQQLARITGNPILQLLVGLVSDLLETSRTLHPSPIDRSTEAAEQLVRDHQSIVEAIGSHNAGRAREAMRQHLKTISMVEQGAL